MKRMELIANRSVEEEITGALETKLPGFYYTLLPAVHGRGRRDYRLGTATWPEENFMLISYIGDEGAALAEAAVKEVKDRFPTEGIKLFFAEASGNAE
jgi:hypothetical protein